MSWPKAQPGPYVFFTRDPFSASAANTSVLNATASTISLSRISIARRTLPYRLECRVSARFNAR
jgi:hypothetical protein